MPLTYALEPDLAVAEFMHVLNRSTLGERRPMDNVPLLDGMLRQADVIVTARNDSGAIVGVSRALTDFCFCTYLADLAVDESCQRQGIGQELIRRTHLAAGLHTRLILLAAPKAESYYPHVGFSQHMSCWTLLPTAPFPVTSSPA